MPRSRSLFIVLLVLCSSVVFAQSPKQWLKHGDKSFLEGDYYGAAFYYKKAFDQDSNDVFLNWKYAEALRLYNDYEKAEPAYAHLVSIDEEDEYPLALFWQSTMLKHNRKYARAQEGFANYIKIFRTQSVYHYKKAKQEEKSCAWVLNHLADSNEITPALLEGAANSTDAEMSPFLARDSTLYFAALRYDTARTKRLSNNEAYRVRLFATLPDSSTAPLDSLFNHPSKDAANLVLSPDGELAFFTWCEQGNCAIYYREREGDDWGSAKVVKSTRVSGYMATHPFPVEQDGKKYLLFSSNRPRGRGGMDLWYSEITKGPKFGRVRNLGRSVNTLDNEITPFYDTLTQELYFSSTWHYGYGGWDVFKAAGPVTRPGDPVNAGQPVNTAANDLYYRTNRELNRGVMASNRPGGNALKGETCCNDLYAFHLEPIPVKVDTPPPPDTPSIPEKEPPVGPVLAKLGLLPLTLYFENDQPNPRSTSTTTRANYLDLLSSFTGDLTDYKQVNDSVRFTAFLSSALTVPMRKLPQLADSLIAYLERGYAFQLGMRGYTSPLAATDYNNRLAQRRIVSVQNFLRAYRDGALQPYLDKGQLTFHSIPVGEYLSDEGLSDDRLNKAASVYSLQALQARRVEISWINQELPGDTNAALKPNKLVNDLGTLANEQTRTVTFVLSNPGRKPLEVDSLLLPCDCLEAISLPDAIPPGGNGSLTVRFTAKKPGPFRKRLVIYSNAYEQAVEVFVTGKVSAP